MNEPRIVKRFGIRLYALRCPHCISGELAYLLGDDGTIRRYRCYECAREWAIDGRQLDLAGLATDDDGFRLG